MVEERTRARFLAEFTLSELRRFFAPLRMTSEGLGMTIWFCLLVLSAFCFLPTLFRLLTPDFWLLNPDS